MVRLGFLKNDSNKISLLKKVKKWLNKNKKWKDYLRMDILN